MGLEYMGEYYRNYAQVNLNHIRNNLELVRATIKKGCKLMVVLKANAFYEQYPGSINDISQLTCMIDKAYDYFLLGTL